MKSKMSLKNLQVSQSVYHRNGISGIGFYALAFSYEEEEENGKIYTAIATVSERDLENFRGDHSHDPDTRVLMLTQVGSISGIDLTATMRGDYFHVDLCRWLIEQEDLQAVKLQTDPAKSKEQSS